MCGYSAPPSGSVPKQYKKKPPRPKAKREERQFFWSYLAIGIIVLVIISLFSYFITR
jgi:heme/copper-type cytochrome/quinol oxidase subunit 2